MKKIPSIQRVEISDTDVSLHCPFCGKVAYRPTGKQVTKYCAHTLFVAHDEGFEYRAPAFDKAMGISGVSNDDIKLGKNGYDGFTDRLKMPTAVKFASYQGAPSFFGAYYGFCQEP